MTRSGDVANWLTLASTAGFFLAVAANELGYVRGTFSAQWAKDGFCISNKGGQPLLQSHAFCFYGDTVTALVLWWVIKQDRKAGVSERVLGPLEPGILGIFAHGCAHLSLGFLPQTTEPEPVAETKPFQTVGLAAFWFFLLRSINKQIGDKVWMVLAILFTCGQVLLVAPKFGFTYVHVGLMTTSTAVALTRTEKDKYYDLEGWVINFPITLMAWLEACGCDSLKYIGGHFWYDIEIPVAMFAFWWIARGWKSEEKIK